ncbi:hypothetical protein ASG90_04600 [Nocardioides sp. Soil797]|nr:hypothetical protein ASG90_04600 [Nocardioides sp. Soil797]
MEILRPLPGVPAPVLSVDGAVLVVALGDAVRRWPMTGLQLASYSTSVGIETRLHRSGWRLLDSSGTVLAWLSNWDVECYDPADVAAFAERHDLAVIDQGHLEASRLRRSAPRESRIGPGTSPATQYVAPARQWVLALGLIGNVMLWWPWGLSLQQSDSVALKILSILVLIGALVLCLIPMIIVASLPTGAFRVLAVLAALAAVGGVAMLVPLLQSSHDAPDFLVPVTLLGVAVTTLAGFAFGRLPMNRASLEQQRITHR